MNISKRIQSVPSSTIMELLTFESKAKNDGKKVYHLNIGQPDIKTPEGFLKAIREYKGEILERMYERKKRSYRHMITSLLVCLKIQSIDILFLECSFNFSKLLIDHFIVGRSFALNLHSEHTITSGDFTSTHITDLLFSID